MIDADDIVYESIDSTDTLREERYFGTGILAVRKEDIEAMPTIELPERKKGRWIDYTDEGYVECPFCHSATNCDGNKDELHFCFSCGADMRGGER